MPAEAAPSSFYSLPPPPSSAAPPPGAAGSSQRHVSISGGNGSEGGLSNAELTTWTDLCHGRMTEDSIAFLAKRFFSMCTTTTTVPTPRPAATAGSAAGSSSLAPPSSYAAGDAAASTTMNEAVPPAPVMSPSDFVRYMRSTGAFKGGCGSSCSTGGSSNTVPGDGASTLPPVLVHLFRAFDSDGDGVVSFTDFLYFHLAMNSGGTDDHLPQLLFRAYDADRDGRLSLVDICRTIAAGTEMVRDLDVNSKKVQQAIQEEAMRLFAFLNVYRGTAVEEATFYLIAARHPEVLEKMKLLM